MGFIGNQTGTLALISIALLKEPVTIQYSGNRKKMANMIRITTANTL